MKIVQENHCIGYWKGQGESTFVQLANFGLKPLKHIRAPTELPQFSGFVVEVTQKQRSRGGSSVVKG